MRKKYVYSIGVMINTINNSTNINYHGLYEEARGEITCLRGEIKELTRQLDWFRRQLFGKKSERIVDIPGEYPDLPGFELPDPPSEDEDGINIPGHKRARKKGGSELVIPDDLPREEIVHELSGEQLVDRKTGKTMVPFGSESVEKLACRPGEYYVQKHVYIKYKVPGEPLSGVAQASASPCVIDSSKFEPSFMADLVFKKYGLHLPLNRIRELMGGSGIEVSPQTLSSLVVKLGYAVAPLYELMVERMFDQGVIFTDDTPVQMLDPGAGKTKKARMWIYLGGKPNAPPYHIYKFSEDWSHKHPINFLEDFSGIFHSDAYEAYEKLDAAREDVVWAACWSHARRKFFDALGEDTEFILQVLRIMRYLFWFERIAWRRSPEERFEIRRKKETPLVDKLFNIIKEKQNTSNRLPTSKLSQAIQYMLRREDNFKVYLGNPDIRMENNPALSLALENPQLFRTAA